MKTIAVLVPSLTIEYCQDFLGGITSYFSDKDVRLIISQTQLLHNETGLYDYQYWNSVNILKSQEIDAYIIPAGLYAVKRTAEELRNLFKDFTPRPIICSAMDIGLENSYVVKIDSYESINQIIKHFKETHNCKHIAFMSANSTNSAEAIERFAAYKKALKQNGLEYDENLVFDGFFTDFGAHNDLLSKYKNKSEIQFDGLVCANDNMAVGSIKALTELGIDVPQKIIVSGFDNSPLSFFSRPKLSTVDQDIFGQGEICAKLAYDVLNGIEIPKETLFTPITMFRQSCNCIPINNMEVTYVDTKGSFVIENDHTSSLFSIMMNNITEKMNITTILDMIRSCNTLRQIYYNLKYLVGQCELNSMFVNLYKTPVYADNNDTPVLPDEVELIMYAENLNYKEGFTPGTIFKPSERIFPQEASIEGPGNYILQPIFAGESIFGYFTAKIKNTNFPSYQMYLKILGTAISQSYEYTNKLIQTEKLSTEVIQLNDLAKTDELTGLLNRRGFMELGQRALDILQEISNAGVVFFADMDGLKKINDTYGHKMGDKAIQSQGQVLKRVFRSSDIIGRISGDEFAIIAKGMLITMIPVIRKKINYWCKKISIENELPFTISLSIGAVDLEGGSSLQSLLSEADKLLYKEKSRKHNKQK